MSEALSIVHLAFEDHLRPGSGGGGARTHEIDRRLATRHRVTVVTTRYPGARGRVEDGVVYRPLGLNLGYFGNVVTYFLALPFFVAFCDADLVVEDFAAPISSALVPLFTRRPTVAVVQWLFARERSARYRLPLFVFEELGLRLHCRFVAVSGYIARRIEDANARAAVTVVPGGVSRPADLATIPVVPGRVVYLGRLEWGPKGLDLLVGAFARLRDLPAARLVIAGDGPDAGKLVSACAAAGIGDRVDMIGRIEGSAKWELLSSAAVVAIPSRHESFGLVGIEAAAAGTPVVAFDLPPLEEIFSEGGALFAPRYDAGAFSGALRRVLTEPALRSRLAEQARSQAGRYDWDQAARAHEAVYEAAVHEGAVHGAGGKGAVVGAAAGKGRR